MNRLATIATRQRKGRVRELLFACFVALAAATTVGTAIHATATSQVAQR